MADMKDIDELAAKLESHRESIEEMLLQEPEDDGLRDMLQEVEEAIELLEAEDGEAPMGEVVQLEARVAERLKK